MRERAPDVGNDDSDASKEKEKGKGEPRNVLSAGNRHFCLLIFLSCQHTGRRRPIAGPAERVLTQAACVCQSTVCNIRLGLRPGISEDGGNVHVSQAPQITGPQPPPLDERPRPKAGFFVSANGEDDWL